MGDFLPLNSTNYTEETYLELTGFSFEAAHLTYSKEKGEYGLHGHSFNVRIKIWGRPDPDTYIIIDTFVVRELLEEIIQRLDHKVVIGRNQYEIRSMLEKNNIQYTVLPYPQATMEALSQYIGKILWSKLSRYNIKTVETCVSQGSNEYACYKINV